MKRFFPLLLCGVLVPLISASAQKLTDQFPVQPAGKSAPGKSSKTKRAPQTQVAAKGAFPIVKVADVSVKRAMPATDLATAKKMAGKNVFVVGTVFKVYAPKSNSVVLLNFAKDYKTALVGAVKAADFKDFPNLSALAGKKVLLSGKIVIFKGAPEVELDKVGAIRVVK